MRRPEILLAVGAATGVALAAFGVANPTIGETETVPAGSIAEVNGATISVDDYQRAVRAIAADRRDGITPALRRRAIDRLIDEELLVQRGVELGLATRDRKVRNNLTAAVIDLIVARAEQSYRAPGDDELRALYRDEGFYFRGPDLIRVDQLYVSGDRAAERAADLARRARAGESFADLRAHADTPPFELPATALPAAKLRDYIGPSAARQALTLSIGAVSEPVRGAAGVRIVRVVERVAAAAPPFEQVRDRVRAEHKRRAGDRALRRFLDSRRNSGRIAIAEERL